MANFLGNLVDRVGTYFNLPEYGISEALGGGQTTNTYNYQANQGNVAGPVDPRYYQQGGTPQQLTGSGPVYGPPVPTQSNGQVLGTSTSKGGGGGNPRGASIQALKDSNPAYANLSDQAILNLQNQQNGLRNEISSGWDNYIGQLNDIYNNGLGQQRSAQENIANSQYDQGVNSINAQKAKSLRDIANNTANAFQAGNIYLGAQGAGDSSAANQYSYALNKQAGKQTGDLNQFVSTQIQQLGSQRDQQINQIASWFADAQNQLKQAMANGQLSKSQDLANMSKDLLNRALAQVDQIKQNSQNQYNALLGWAASNSQNIGQLQQNIAGIPQAIGVPTIDSGGNYVVPTGYGANTNDQRQNQLFQNPSWFS